MSDAGQKVTVLGSDKDDVLRGDGLGNMAYIRIDAAIFAAPVVTDYFTNDAGKANTGLRLTSMGRITGEDGEVYSVWRIRNSNEDDRVVRLEAYGSKTQPPVEVTARANSETLILSKDEGATHKLLMNDKQVDVQATGKQSFSDSRTIASGPAAPVVVDDVIEAGAGNDKIDAGKGDNTVDAGEGDDVVVAGSGNDVVRGGAGKDTVKAGDGDNDIRGGEGDDTIITGSGKDRIAGGEGADRISGGDSFDTSDHSGETGKSGITAHIGKGVIIDSYGNEDTIDSIEVVRGTGHADLFYGSDGYDIFDGQGGDDSMYGGAGGDEMYGVFGDDMLYGEEGSDVLIGGEGNDLLHGGAGFDSVDYSDVGGDRGIKAYLAKGVVYGTYADEVDTVIEVEGVKGSMWDDVIIGTDGGNWLRGFNGNDLLAGGKGDEDGLLGGEGIDTFVFSRGDGFDIVQDFEQGETLDLRGFGFGSFDEMSEGIVAQTYQGVESTFIYFGFGDVLVLQGVNVSLVDKSDFLL
jgi:Ca2+-binding RTX toxin-like protein